MDCPADNENMQDAIGLNEFVIPPYGAEVQWKQTTNALSFFCQFCDDSQHNYQPKDNDCGGFNKWVYDLENGNDTPSGSPEYVCGWYMPYRPTSPPQTQN